MWLRVLIPRADGEDDPSTTTSVPMGTTQRETPTSTTFPIAEAAANITTAAGVTTTTGVVSWTSVSSVSSTSWSNSAQAASTISSASTISPASTIPHQSQIIMAYSVAKAPTITPTSVNVANSADSTSQPQPHEPPPTLPHHHDISKILMVFGSLGIVAIIILLIFIIIILRKKRKQTLFYKNDNSSSNNAQPKYPFTAERLQQAQIPPRAVSGETVSINSQDNTMAIPFSWNTNELSMNSRPASMAAPIPQQYQQFAPAPLKVYREERRPSLSNAFNPFTDPLRSSPQEMTHEHKNEGTFENPSCSTPVTLQNLQSQESPDRLSSFTPPLYGRPSQKQAPISIQSVQSSKFSNFASLLHPLSTTSSFLPPSPSRSSKFSNFRSLLGRSSVEVEEKWRLEDQRKALAMLAGAHEETPVDTPMARAEKGRTGYF